MQQTQSAHCWNRRLQAGLALAVLGAMVVWVEPLALWEALRDAHWGCAALAFALVPLNVGLDAAVWHVLLRPVAGPLPFRQTLAAVMAGLAVGFFTPARVGEYAGRAFALNADGWTVSVSVFVQRMLDMAVAVVAGGVAVGLLLSEGRLPDTLPWRFAWLAGTAAGCLLTLALARPGWVDALGRRWLPDRRSLHRRTAFLARLTASDMCALFAGSALRYAVYIGQFVLLARAFLPNAALQTLAVAGGALFFVKFLVPSFTLMDLGVREGTAAFLFQALGWSAAAGLNAALLLFAYNLVLPAALGVPFAWNLLSAPTVPAASPASSAELPP